MTREKIKKIFYKRNLDGSWHIGNGTTRIDIFTKHSGVLNQDNMMKEIKSWNFDALDKQGYWLYPDDFKNIEVTLIIKMFEGVVNKDHAFSVVSRSILHDNKGEEEIKEYPKAYCGGSSYHNNILGIGKLQMKKEQYHADYIIDDPNDKINLESLYNKKIGFKVVVYNFDNNSKVKLESFVDVKNQGMGPYVKLHEKVDDGNWGINDEAKMDECGSKNKGAVISWGSPMIILKTNNLSFDLYDVEVREIIPP